MKLLIVEDDSLLGGGLRAVLGRSGFDVTWVRDGRDALELLRNQEFVAMVLDIGLPGLNGMDVLRQLRADDMRLPVLVLTARDTTSDKVLSLEAGADDHVVKTADMEELIARLRALVRRAGRSSGLLRAGALTLNLDSRSVSLNGTPIVVSRREFDLLRSLVEGAGRVLTRRQLEQSVYGWNHQVDSNTIEVHIHNLRLKLGSSALTTVRGVGYTLARSAV
jgi:two-component system OmpR family response regulator/two-component system response regulator QseB